MELQIYTAAVYDEPLRALYISDETDRAFQTSFQALIQDCYLQLYPNVSEITIYYGTSSLINELEFWGPFKEGRGHNGYRFVMPYWKVQQKDLLDFKMFAHYATQGMKRLCKDSKDINWEQAEEGLHKELTSAPTFLYRYEGDYAYKRVMELRKERGVDLGVTA